MSRSVKSNEASTKHFSSLFIILELSTLEPKTIDNPPKMIDLPAPVSPVIEVIPFLKEISNESIKAVS